MTYSPPEKTICDIPPQEIIKICEKSSPQVFKLLENPPSLSVLMPLYKAKHIGWVAFESLCRQELISFNWELVIIEENFDESMGLDTILNYGSRLKKVGCCNIVYLTINKWIPLSVKWYYLGKLSNRNSNVICFHSADGYSAPERLMSQYEVLSKGQYNWYKLAGNIVYDIESDKHVKFHSTEPTRKDTHSRATIRSVLDRLPLASIRTSVDGWMHNVLFPEDCNLTSYLDTSDIWKRTINVNGLNTISFKRSNRILNPVPPLYGCCDQIENHIPNDISTEIKKYVSLAKNNREARNKDNKSLKSTSGPPKKRNFGKKSKSLRKTKKWPKKR